MTRYTSIGRKRTYLEASFSSERNAVAVDDVEDDPSNSVLDHDSELVEKPSSRRPAKKRKRTKQKQPMDSDGGTSVKGKDRKGGDAGDELANDTDRTDEAKEAKEAKEVRKAYMNREGNRQKEAKRSERSEQRRLKRKQEKFANITCFACREKGHAVRDCPKADQSDKSAAEFSKSICYRCGSAKHTLSRCKKPENPDKPLPYASCYVCSGKGHLASSCPQNKDKGVYPNGGCCKLCGETSHLARNCPTRKQVQESPALLVGTGRDAGADEDDFHTLRRVNAGIDLEEWKEREGSKKKPKATKNEEVKASLVNKAVKPIVSQPIGRKKVVVF